MFVPSKEADLTRFICRFAKKSSHSQVIYIIQRNHTLFAGSEEN